MEERVGWELIWRRGNDHPRYGTCAAPDAAVTGWAATLFRRFGHGSRLWRRTARAPSGRLRVSHGRARYLAQRHSLDRRGVRAAGSAKGTCPTCGRPGRTAHSMPCCRYRRSTITGRRRSSRRSRRSAAYSTGRTAAARCPLYGHARLSASARSGGGRPDRRNRARHVRRSGVLISMSWTMVHRCPITIAEGELRDLLQPFDILRVWTALRRDSDSTAVRGKWLASARRPLRG